MRAPAADARDLAKPTVVIFATVGAPSPAPRPRRIRRGRGSKPRTAKNERDLEENPPAACSRVTVTRPNAFPSGDAAASWLRTLSRDETQREVEVELGLAAVNRVVGAYRVAAADPYVTEVDRSSPLTARVGYGAGHAIAAGNWDEALLAPPRRTKRVRRIEILHPQLRVAALLAGRETTLVAEELILRARLDFDHGRPRHAALQLDTALEALLLELGDEPLAGESSATSETGRAHLEAQQEDLAWLGKRVRELEEVADRALEGDLDRRATDLLEEALFRTERILRRRHYGLT